MIFASYLFSIEDEVAVKEFLYELLDSKDRNVQLFVMKVCQNWTKLWSKQNDDKKTKLNNERKQTVVTKGEVRIEKFYFLKMQLA